MRIVDAQGDARHKEIFFSCRTVSLLRHAARQAVRFLDFARGDTFLSNNDQETSQTLARRGAVSRGIGGRFW